MLLSYEQEKLKIQLLLYIVIEKKIKIFRTKKIIWITKIEHAFKDFSSTYDVEILNFFKPELKLNPIQDGGGGQKGPFTSFSPVTFTNVGIRPQNFLTFSFNPFDRLVKNFKCVPSASPKLLNLNQDPLPSPLKKGCFFG